MTRIHIVSLPHTLLTKTYDWCAYTAKVRRFVDMLLMAGHAPIVYGPDVHDDIDPRAEYVPIVDGADRTTWFGSDQWDISTVFNHWDAGHPSWATMNNRASAAIRERWQPRDIIGLIGGLCQQQIMSDLADLSPLTCEWGIGYSGVIPGTHRAFESYAWMHHVAGYYRADEIRFFDTVIPNCFDKDDFTVSTRPGEYLLYMGRPTTRKGLPIIEEMARRLTLPVLIAGQEGPSISGTEYVGLVTGKKKADLLAGARAVLTPTTYLEPFGGVAVEAMMSGTPVIATDYGAFTETVIHGETGYRCRMLSEFLLAADQVLSLDRQHIRDYAVARWSTDTGSRLYANYLHRLESLYGDGWYADAVAL